MSAVYALCPTPAAAQLAVNGLRAAGFGDNRITILTATFAGMALLYMLFSKFVPIISIWEMKVGNQPHPAVPVDDEDELATAWRAQS